VSAVRPLAELASVDVTRLRHVGEKRAGALAELGITSVFDLLTTYPRRYIDRTRRAELADLRVGDEVAVFGEVVKVHSRTSGNGRKLVEVVARDGDQRLNVTFFNQPWRAGQLVVGVQALFFGKVGLFRDQPQMTNPIVDVLVGASGEERDPSRVGRVVALYPTSSRASLTSWEIGGFIEESLRRAGEIADPVSNEQLSALGLVGRDLALRNIHTPSELDDVEPARRRLAFDELLRLQLLVTLRRQYQAAHSAGLAHRIVAGDLAVTPGASVPANASLVAQFLSGHRFSLTSAQRRVLHELATDLCAPTPMHRLLQGDVGSGKTAVATVAMLMCVDGAHQAALMAPTEVLAEQHLASLRRDVAGLHVADASSPGVTRPLRVELLSGRVKGAQRRAIEEGLAAGTVDIVVGTHALISSNTVFDALGLVVIDEQHRFGVDQRAALRAKGMSSHRDQRDPDVLVMTATPIPRTAAMVVFGDLDVSVIDELPPGRTPIATTWLPAAADDAWAHVRAAVGRGERAYVVCPLVEESDRVEAASAVEERTRLATGPLRGLSVGLLHGQMSASDKDDVMDQFRRGEIQVLVATVVIEVGVDVPEATVIVIEDAWRFGLAQLHQLRGRVGRGEGASQCFLLGTGPSDDATTRLEALVASTDGFYLAEVDLELRGAGTLLGARQRGLSDLRLANLRRDSDLVEPARSVATSLVADGLAPDMIAELGLCIDEAEAAYLFSS
jgi:ATP-dependent DNA helicase RecG